jgi:predicted nucleotidyltransferase component of viral defense system
MRESSKSLKVKAKSIAILNNITVQEVMQSYMFERILARISRSQYHDNFILKGGLLLSSISGIQSRTTMDMDTMLRGLELEKEKLETVLEEILSIDANDDVIFVILGVEEIRVEDYYGGLRFKINGLLNNIRNYLSIDISTGDIITPCEVEYQYKMIFEDEYILVKSYNSETILAEKFQTILESNGAKGRMKDYYDIWFFVNFRWDVIDFDLLNKAIFNTFTQRGSIHDLSSVEEILDIILDSSILRKRWNEYSSKHNYTKDVSFDNVINSLFEFSKKVNRIGNTRVD